MHLRGVERVMGGRFKGFLDYLKELWCVYTAYGALLRAVDLSNVE